LRFLGCRRGWSVLDRCTALGLERADCTQKNRGQDNPSHHAAKRPSLCRFVWSIHDEWLRGIIPVFLQAPSARSAPNEQRTAVVVFRLPVCGSNKARRVPRRRSSARLLTVRQISGSVAFDVPRTALSPPRI